MSSKSPLTTFSLFLKMTSQSGNRIRVLDFMASKEHVATVVSLGTRNPGDEREMEVEKKGRRKKRKDHLGAAWLHGVVGLLGTRGGRVAVQARAGFKKGSCCCRHADMSRSLLRARQEPQNNISKCQPSAWRRSAKSNVNGGLAQTWSTKSALPLVHQSTGLGSEKLPSLC